MTKTQRTVEENRMEAEFELKLIDLIERANGNGLHILLVHAALLKTVNRFLLYNHKELDKLKRKK